MKDKKKEAEKKNESKEKIKFELDKKAIIAAILNFVLVGLGYAYVKMYKKAILMFVVYVIIVLVVSYVATFFSPLVWLGLLANLFFAWDAYRISLKK